MSNLGVSLCVAFSEDVGGELLTLMVPFADLANHDNDNNSTFNFNTDRTR